MEPFVLRNCEVNQPEVFILESWDKELTITAGFTGRQGGVSQAPYDSMNCAFHVADHEVDVIHNRMRLVESLGMNLDAWTCGEQVHSNHIEIVYAKDKGRGNKDRSTAFQNTDGLLTNVPGILLTSFYADCVPLYFYDAQKQVVGLAHAGWKGTVSEIASNMVNQMKQEYGSHVADIKAAIGPSIGPCCYEVDDKVMSHVYALEKEIGDHATPSSTWYQNKTAGKSMLNLKEINRHIMIKAGIMPIHIECTTWCTSCNNDVFFSFRKDAGVTGRMASWIGLK
ncbi:peptidoglycan editing factor PgeF [Paenibacillus sp. CMAA1364]